MKYCFILLHSFCVGILVLIIILFISLTNNFYEISEVKQDYIYIECEFEKYDVLVNYFGKGVKKKHLIYVKEYEKPLIITSIVSKNTNFDYLKQLKKGVNIKLYCEEIDNKDYQYSILELKTKSIDILKFEDSIEAIKNNDIKGFVFCPIMFSICLILEILLIKFNFNYYKEEKEYKDIIKNYKNRWRFI